MQTLQKRLTEYCTANDKPIPYGGHLSLLGTAVANEIKSAGKYDLVKKAKETILVNAYPKELVPIVDEVIKLYFTDQKALKKKATVAKKEKRFNYDVEAHKVEAFEAALKKCGLGVHKNKSSHGITQYCVPAGSPASLVKLGKTFQTERWLQENRQRQEKFKNKPL